MPGGAGWMLGCKALISRLIVLLLNVNGEDERRFRYVGLFYNLSTGVELLQKGSG